ncbi:MAG TPA: DUF167 domain-containing protein [Gemmatimonadota bacterium]|nr:DUF167 domain-containing protein [Gemmatimonadota bacterium]
MSGNSNVPRCRLLLKVATGSSAAGIQGWLGDALKVRVTAAPERGKANAAVLEILAGTLGLPREAIRIVSGHGSSRKVVEIEGMSEMEVRRLLQLV